MIDANDSRPAPEQEPGNFIEVYPGAFKAAVCREMIDAFNASGKLTRGETSGGLNTKRARR